MDVRQVARTLLPVHGRIVAAGDLAPAATGATEKLRADRSCANRLWAPGGVWISCPGGVAMPGGTPQGRRDRRQGGAMFARRSDVAGARPGPLVQVPAGSG